MTKRIVMKRIAGLVTFLAVSACGSIPTMIMPDQLETSGDVYEVSGANGSFLPTLFDQAISFGPYVASVKTSGEQTKVSGPTILNGGQQTRQSVQRASFTMRGGKSGAWKGTCIRTARKISQYETSFVSGERVIRTEVEPLVTEDVRTERCDLKHGNQQREGHATTGGERSEQRLSRVSTRSMAALVQHRATR
jgi:hypothetical protein